MFDEWKRLARLANENSSPCDDCTQSYADAMGRHCQRSKVRVIFMVLGKSAVVKARNDARAETSAYHPKSKA